MKCAVGGLYTRATKVKVKDLNAARTCLCDVGEEEGRTRCKLEAGTA